MTRASRHRTASLPNLDTNLQPTSGRPSPAAKTSSTARWARQRWPSCHRTAGRRGSSSHRDRRPAECAPAAACCNKSCRCYGTPIADPCLQVNAPFHSLICRLLRESTGTTQFTCSGLGPDHHFSLSTTVPDSLPYVWDVIVLQGFLQLLSSEGGSCPGDCRGARVAAASRHGDRASSEK